MTVIVYKGNKLVADSRATITSEDGGTRVSTCKKLFRKSVGRGKKKHDVIIATAGDSFPSLAFVEWYGSGKPKPESLLNLDAEFDCLVLTPDGLFQYDSWLVAEKIETEWHVIGCGAKAAQAALLMGASPERAVSITCQVDPYCALPLQVESLGHKAKGK